jgi:hypothetical protein
MERGHNHGSAFNFRRFNEIHGRIILQIETTSGPGALFPIESEHGLRNSKSLTEPLRA